MLLHNRQSTCCWSSSPHAAHSCSTITYQCTAYCVTGFATPSWIMVTAMSIIDSATGVKLPNICNTCNSKTKVVNEPLITHCTGFASLVYMRLYCYHMLVTRKLIRHKGIHKPNCEAGVNKMYAAVAYTCTFMLLCAHTTALSPAGHAVWKAFINQANC